MKFIKAFKLFEQVELDMKSKMMGRLLHLYGSIPLEKEKASIVIQKIIFDTMGKYYKLGEDVSIFDKSEHDRVRFKDYFDSLLISKDSRGHNFEGTLSGFFNGELSKRGEKWDLIIEDKTWSVKFVDNPSKAPEIGSFNNLLLKAGLDIEVSESGGLTILFRSDNTELKERVFDVISEGITGGWLVSYPVVEENKSYIRINIITLDMMRELLVIDGKVASPKAGIKSLYTIALSAKFKHKIGVLKSLIEIPSITVKELSAMLNSTSSSWSRNVFGKYSNKIRPDVLKYIKNNSIDIADKLTRFDDF